MAFVLVIAGMLMIVTGAKGTYAQFGAQVASDFTGPGNFTYWLAAIGSVGALGYVNALRTVSRLFLALILIAMVLANKGFFNQLTAALNKGPIAPAPANQLASGDGIISQLGTAIGNAITGGKAAPTTGLFGPNAPTPSDPNTMWNFGPAGTINYPSSWLGK